MQKKMTSKIEKPMTRKQFKQKVEAQLWKVNQAVISAGNEVSQLLSLTEEQMERLDNDSEGIHPRGGRTKDNVKFYNIVSDVEEWASAIDEVLEGVDTSVPQARLGKLNA